MIILTTSSSIQPCVNLKNISPCCFMSYLPQKTSLGIIMIYCEPDRYDKPICTHFRFQNANVTSCPKSTHISVAIYVLFKEFHLVLDVCAPEAEIYMTLSLNICYPICSDVINVSSAFMNFTFTKNPFCIFHCDKIKVEIPDNVLINRLF